MRVVLRVCVPVHVHVVTCSSNVPKLTLRVACVHLQMQPMSHLPHFFLGVVFTKQGRFSDALHEYETALFYHPSFFPAIHNMGSLHIILGNMDQALYFFECVGVAISLRVSVCRSPVVSVRVAVGAACCDALPLRTCVVVSCHSAALKRLAESQGEEVEKAEKEMKVSNILSMLTHQIIKCFSEVRGGEENYSLVAATLHMYVKHLARLDFALFHLNMGFLLQDIGAFELSKRHFQETLALQVGIIVC